MAQLTLTLQTRTLKAEPTVAGFTIYEGGEIHDNNRLVGTFVVFGDVVNGATDVQGLDTSAVTMTLFFLGQTHGGHGHGGGSGGGGQARGQAPENMFLEGANDFEGQPSHNQPRETRRAIGSVSAASQQFASHIGKQWERQGNRLIIG